MVLTQSEFEGLRTRGGTGIYPTPRDRGEEMKHHISNTEAGTKRCISSSMFGSIQALI